MLDDIKELISESKESLRKDILDLKNILTLFGTRVKAVEDAVQRLHIEHSSLKKEVDGIKEDSQYLFNEVTEFCIAEFQNRTNRMSNIILFGIDEHEYGTLQDRKQHDC